MPSNKTRGQRYVASLTEEAARDMLAELIDRMDEDDEQDLFGTEGWRERYGFRD
jgi:hypothetical protein